MVLSHSEIEIIIKNTVLAEIISASEAAGMPKSFIENIIMTKESNTTWKIENNWTGDNGEPLAVFFEYGTVDHYIKPKSPNGVLAFPSGGSNSGSSKAIYSKNSQSPKKGNIIFSKGHYVKGLPALEPMHNGFDIGIQRMKKELS